MVADEDTALSDECELKQCDSPSHFESAARVTECSAEDNSRSVRCVCKNLLDICVRKLCRRDFGVATCEV